MATDMRPILLCFEVQPSHDSPGDWVVEAIDDGSEGECYVALFSGTNAEARAQEYASWKNDNGEGMTWGLNRAAPGP